MPISIRQAHLPPASDEILPAKVFEATVLRVGAVRFLARHRTSYLRGNKCYACRYSGTEPDDPDLTCGHPKTDNGGFGLRTRLAVERFCGRARYYFEQHPMRNKDGST